MRLVLRVRWSSLENRALPIFPHTFAFSCALRSVIVALTFMGLTGCSGFVRNPTVNSKDPGFFGWHFHAPFDTTEVKTVAVFFKSNVFRRDLEKQLTEAVIKEINLRTPYRVVGNSAEADSLLTGTITSDNKNLIVEAPTNLPREVNASIVVQTNWTHNPPTDIESSRVPTTISETINFVPEVGETAVSAYNHVIQSIAKQIVDMMEQPWYNEQDLE
jgi:Lipopolysaccharide-assembly